MATPLKDNASTAGEQRAGRGEYRPPGFQASGRAPLPQTPLFLVAPLRSMPASASARPPITRVLGAVSVPGFGMALTAVGFGTITTFGALMFSERGWSSAWGAFTVVSVFFILGRVFFGHLPDKLGGARVALVCVMIEAIGARCCGRECPYRSGETQMTNDNPTAAHKRRLP